MPTSSRQVPLREIASVALGITLRGADASRHDPEGTHRLIRIGDISEDGVLCHDDISLISPEPDAASRYALWRGDVLVAGRGSRATAAIFEDSRSSIASGQLLVIRPNQDAVVPEYLCWYLNLARTQESLAAEARGSYIRSISTSTLAELRVPLLPLPRQRLIAEISALRLREKELMTRLVARRAELVDNTLQRLLRD